MQPQVLNFSFLYEKGCSYKNTIVLLYQNVGNIAKISKV